MLLESLQARLSDRTTLYRAAFTILGYIVATQIAHLFSNAPAVFPIQSGVALAALVLWGTEYSIAVFLAALGTYLWIGSVPLIALFLALGNTLQAFTAAYLLKRSGFDPLLHRMRDIFSLLLVATFASMIVPSVGMLGYAVQEALGGSGLDLPWSAWWIGHILSLLIIAPFLIRWLSKLTFDRSRRELVETAIAFVFLIGINFVIFIDGIGAFHGVALVYLMLVPLFWMSLRLGARSVTLALLITSVMALAGTILGVGATPAVALGERLFLNEIFLEVIAVIFLVLTAVSEERRTVKMMLESHIAKLETALQKISQEDRAKGEFIAILAHELRNPLSPVLSGIELLKLNDYDADTTATLSDMEVGVQRIKRLLDDLLDIARITRKKFDLQKSAIDLREIVGRSVNSTKELFDNRNHELIISMPENGVVLLADPMRLEQVLVNLLTNAAKYTDQGGRIELSAHQAAGKTIISVRDNGIGIPEELREQVFEPFHQVEGSGRGGLGIGLTIVKRLIEMHGGTIRVESEGRGTGSMFVIELPSYS